MLSAFAKVLSFFLNDEAETTEDDELTARELNDEDKGLDCTDEKEGLSKSSHGKVTHTYNDYGLIDGEIFFTFQTVMSEKRLGLGEEVSYVAKRETLGSGWRATQVAIATSWDTDDDDKEDKSMVGIIEKFNGEFGTINGQIQFRVAAVCMENYVPCVGDYVTVDVKRVSGLLEASNMKPLRMFEKEGQISAVQQDHGYIDGDTFFNLAACCDDYNPRKWDRVQTVVIESAQGQCSWRAISIKPVIVNPTMRQQNKSEPSNL